MSCGFMILPKESLNSSKPMMSMIAATASVATYSILACPYGCSSSALCAAILKPAIVMIDEPASDRLLNASAVTAIEWLIVPAKNLPQKSRIFKKIPTIPQRIPYSCLIFPLSSFSLIKNFERNVIMSDPPVSDLIQCLFPNTSI